MKVLNVLLLLSMIYEVRSTQGKKMMLKNKKNLNKKRALGRAKHLAKKTQKASGEPFTTAPLVLLQTEQQQMSAKLQVKVQSSTILLGNAKLGQRDKAADTCTVATTECPCCKNGVCLDETICAMPYFYVFMTLTAICALMMCVMASCLHCSSDRATKQEEADDSDAIVFTFESESGSYTSPPSSPEASPSSSTRCLYSTAVLP